MAIILRKDFITGDFPQPILYVDTMNESGIISEMINITMVHIRNNSDREEVVISKREYYTAKDYNDILQCKSDGFWMLFSEKDGILSLYKSIAVRVYCNTVIKLIIYDKLSALV